MARACRFTTPYGSREIYLDGRPFITIYRVTDKEGNSTARPTDVDTVSKEIKQLLCGEKKSKSSLAGVFDFLKRKKKPRVNPMSKRMIWEPGKPARLFGRARKRRRR